MQKSLFEEVDLLSVSELTFKIKELVEPEFFSVYVEGEVSNFKLAKSGHAYFTLKDKNTSIRCVCFRSSFNRINIDVEDGLKIVVKGSVTIYEAYGTYQILVNKIQVQGQGKLQLEFEKLKAKLYEQGLFKEEYKKPLPEFPGKIGVITSGTGAAIRDILNVLKRRYPVCEVLVYSTLVQGTNAKYEIIKAIENFNRWNNVDVLILSRGGGSIEDLWSFNEEIVARAIFESKIPVISGVGHEIDYTISDFVSDLRAPTPSAAAELAAPDIKVLIENNRNLKKNLFVLLNKNINNFKTRLKSLRLRNPINKVYDYTQNIDKFQEIYDKIIIRKITEKTEKIKSCKRLLYTMNPEVRIDYIKQNLLRLKKQLGVIIKNKIETKQVEINHLKKDLNKIDIFEKVNNYNIEIDNLKNKIQNSAINLLNQKQNLIINFKDILKQVNPKKILKRGYSILYKENKIIKQAEEINKETDIVLEFYNSKLTANIKPISITLDSGKSSMQK